jgi:hypothetical protein
MARVIDDLGHVGRAGKPLALRTYEPGFLPDPAQCVDALILVNDRSDGVPRKRLCLSNGASWDALAFVLDGRGGSVDLTPVVRQIVTEALPGIVQPALEMRVVSPAPRPATAAVALADADKARLVDIVIDLTRRIEELEERLAFAERVGATTEIEVRAQ